jgi:glycerol-3-phosphate dehydrogenase
VNYFPATGLLLNGDGYVHGLTARDAETGEEFLIDARVVVNATGVFTDQIRLMGDVEAERLLVTSQGIHLVFDRSFLKGETALMVPKTSDGRVLFVIPWHGHAVAGTTDTPVETPSLEPQALETEIEFILETAGQYLARPPRREDVLSVFAGLRPLVKGDGKTSALSRDHLIHVDQNGLLTLTGGKWTTYRHMAEDCVDHAITLGRLREEPCPTRDLHIHGWMEDAENLGDLQVYGADAERILAIAVEQPELAAKLHADLQVIGAEIAWAAREEMARTVEDALARRTRSLFLNARAAMEMAGPAARILARELGRDEAWAEAQRTEFCGLADQYLVKN